jgi:hypothetical protein
VALHRVSAAADEASAARLTTAIAIDGKTLRRSFDKAGDRNPLRLDSAVC